MHYEKLNHLPLSVNGSNFDVVSSVCVRTSGSCFVGQVEVVEKVVNEDVDVDEAERGRHKCNHLAFYSAGHSKFPGKYLKQKTD